MQSFCIGASEIKKNILKAVNVLSKWALIQFGIIVLYSDFMRYIYIYDPYTLTSYALLAADCTVMKGGFITA